MTSILSATFSAMVVVAAFTNQAEAMSADTGCSAPIVHDFSSPVPLLIASLSVGLIAGIALSKKLNQHQPMFAIITQNGDS